MATMQRPPCGGRRRRGRSASKRTARLLGMYAAADAAATCSEAEWLAAGESPAVAKQWADKVHAMALWSDRDLRDLRGLRR